MLNLTRISVGTYVSDQICQPCAGQRFAKPPCCLRDFDIIAEISTFRENQTATAASGERTCIPPGHSRHNREQSPHAAPNFSAVGPTPKMPPLPCANPPRTASLFISLSMRRVISLCLGAGATGPVQQQPLLHLLLPVSTQIVTAAARRAHHQTAAPPLLHRTLSRSESPNRTQSNIGLLSTSAQTFTTATRWTSRQPHSLSTPARRFSTSTSQRGTQAVFNPQDDETGQAMVVEITPRAATVCSSPNHLTPFSSLSRTHKQRERKRGRELHF